MKTTKESSRQIALSPDLASLPRVRSLTELCRKFLYEYYETGAPWSRADWWRSFNEAGLLLRAALEEEKARGDRQPLSDQEQEQAYLLLIRVAYFFEPAGPAELFFREQGWLQGRARPGVAPVTKARAKSWSLVVARLQRFRAAIRGAWPGGGSWKRGPGAAGSEPGQRAALPAPLAHQEAGAPRR
jgi:hypothetical protein